MGKTLDKTYEKQARIKEIFTEEIYKKYLYGDITNTELQNIMACDRYSLELFMSNNGYKFRQQVLKEETNHDIFNVIDSEKKAYLLGFYFADGHLQGSRLTISVSEKDEEIINLFQKSICKYYKKTRTKPFLNKKTNYTSKPMVSITFNSKEIAQTLTQYGMGERKTYETKSNFSFIPNNLMIHFIRGYFDGDGTVCCVKTSKKYTLISGEEKRYEVTNYNWNIISHNKEPLLIIKSVLEENYEIRPNILEDKRGNFLIEINKKEDFFKMRDILYADAHFYLSRKREKYFSI